jgi:large subunit ribosomal protein L15
MAMRLGQLKRPKGSRQNRKRKGRGPGSGLGKTSGRGHKGHKARSGYHRRPHREGGQMPLYRKLPKRGFKSLAAADKIEVINLGRLSGLEVPEWTPEVLLARKLIRRGKGKYKVLGQGDFTRACVVHAHAFSKTARAKIEAAGGRCEVIE